MTLQAIVYQRLFIIALLALIFYGVVPLVGAFSVRRMWRGFRNQLTAASLKPSLSYRALHGSDGNGFFRFFGTLQAIQGESRIWLSNGNISVCVDLDGVPVYVLPPKVNGELIDKKNKFGDNSPRKTYWNRVFSLPEGTSFFVSGELTVADGRSCFKKSKQNPLLVIIYDCEDSAFYSHAILSGRQRNEYWNVLTPGSLTVGSFSLFIYFYLLVQLPYMKFAAVTALTFSLVPIIPFLPPGLFLYYIYRNYWKKGRILRAERDLLLLPVNFFGDSLDLKNESFVYTPDKLKYGCFIRESREAAFELVKNCEERKISLMDDSDGVDQYFIFGLVPGQAEDYMAESLVIPGNPVDLSVYATKKAKKYEILSLITFGLGFSINLLILLTVATIIQTIP